MIRKKCSVLFVGKENDAHVIRALDFCQGSFTEVTAFVGKWPGVVRPHLTWDTEFIGPDDFPERMRETGEPSF